MENSLEKTTEEADLIEKSSKKMKIKEGELGVSDSNHQQEREIVEEPKRKISYQEKRVGNTTYDIEMDEQCDEGQFFSDDESELEEDKENEDCPNIRLSRAEKQCIRRPWIKTLILKILGKRVGLKFLERRVTQLWNPKRTVTLADLGNDYYLPQFSNKEDNDKALLEGPWMVADHYLTI